MLGALLQPELEELIAAGRWEELRETVCGLDPADLAEIVIDLPPDSEAAVFRVLPRPIATQVFAHLPLEHQEELIRSVSSEHLREIVTQMTPDDRTRLFEELPAEMTRRLLESLPTGELATARELLGYPAETAGRYMTPRYVALRPEMTVADALEHVRRVGRGQETLHALYIVDGAGKLVEDVRLGSLVLAEPSVRVGDLHDRPSVTVEAHMPREELVQEFQKYDRFSLPVIDADDQMLGIITADDVLDVATEEATEDMQKMGATAAFDEPYLDVGFLAMIRKRAGWLSVLFLGEMLTASVMASFQDQIARTVALALFIPLIISSGGNSGSQTATLIVRSLALGELRLRDWMRVFWRELSTGATLGAWLGLIGFVRVVVWQSSGLLDYGPHYLRIAAVVWVSLVGVVMFGTLAGSMLPIILQRLGVDPATSSTPFVATLVDVTGVVIYFGAAAILLENALL
jgi:magnesium transporter